MINLKVLNRFVQKEQFKMEGIHTVKDLLRQGDWVAKVDLKDAFFSVPIDHQHRKFLRFIFKGKTYQFNCLPFGLSSAPWVFTKTLKPVLAVLRERGVRLIAYIDNILVMTESRNLIQDQVTGMLYLLECLGFIVNRKKSILNPTQVIEFLGLSVDSIAMELRLPLIKMKHIRAEARKLARDISINPYSGTVTGEDEHNKLCSSPSPLILPPPANGSTQHIGEELPMLRGSGLTDTRLPGRTGVVEHQHEQVEWQNSPEARHRLSD